MTASTPSPATRPTGEPDEAPGACGAVSPAATVVDGDEEASGVASGVAEVDAVAEAWRRGTFVGPDVLVAAGFGDAAPDVVVRGGAELLCDGLGVAVLLGVAVDCLGGAIPGGVLAVLPCQENATELPSGTFSESAPSEL